MRWLSESSVSCVLKRRNYNSLIQRRFIVYRKPCPLLSKEYVDWRGVEFYMDRKRDLVFAKKDLVQRFPDRTWYFTFRSDKVRKIGVWWYDEIEVITPTIVVIRDLRNAAR